MSDPRPAATTIPTSRVYIVYAAKSSPLHQAAGTNGTGKAVSGDLMQGSCCSKTTRQARRLARYRRLRPRDGTASALLTVRSTFTKSVTRTKKKEPQEHARGPEERRQRKAFLYASPGP
eukprot:668266-Rhodomonas_salina.2